MVDCHNFFSTFVWLSIPLGTISEIYFQYYTDVCLNQTVSYQCSLTGTDLLALVWRVITTNGTQLGFPVSYFNNYPQSPDEIGGLFNVEKISLSPLISNISFTVQSSIIGYTIICEDLYSSSNDTVVIKATPLESVDITIHTDSFTNSSVNISWTESPCTTIYRYTISSSALEENIIMESTGNSVMVEGLVTSDDEYCVVVTSLHRYYIHTLNSDPRYFVLKVPSAVSNVSVSFKILSELESSRIKLCVRWTEYTSNQDGSNIIEPDLLGYEVMLYNSSLCLSGQSGLLPHNVTEYSFMVENGRNYSVIVIAINGVGLSSNSSTVPVNINIFLEPSSIGSLISTTSYNGSLIESLLTFMPITSTQLRESKYTTVKSRSVSKVSTDDHMITIGSLNQHPSPSTTVSNYQSCPSLVAVAGISVAITLPVTAVITVFVTVAILYYCGYLRRIGQTKATPPPVRNNNLNRTENAAYGTQLTKATSTPTHISELNMTNNTAYGQLASENTNTAIIYDQVNLR